RALSEKYSTDADLLRIFYKTRVVKRSSKKFKEMIVDKIPVADVVNPETGEIIFEGGEDPIPAVKADEIADLPIEEVEVIEEIDDRLILNSLQEDVTKNHEEALLRIYQRLRPGNPPNLDKAREL